MFRFINHCNEVITKDHINKMSCLGQISDREQGSHWCQIKPLCPGLWRTRQGLLWKIRAWKVIPLPRVPWWIPMFWSISTAPEKYRTSTPCLFKHVIKMPRRTSLFATHLNHPYSVFSSIHQDPSQLQKCDYYHKAERNYSERSVYQDNKPIKNQGTWRN